ncbi:cyclin-L1 isoform X2 [Anabrus simplex]|uniref:cyclin-L1 isoform X2 n=1 Tax=Anabrus simplex TaxID=316456 RepID=UPI0034DD97A0
MPWRQLLWVVCAWHQRLKKHLGEFAMSLMYSITSNKLKAKNVLLVSWQPKVAGVCRHPRALFTLEGPSITRAAISLSHNNLELMIPSSPRLGHSSRTIQPMMLDHNYIALKTQVIKAERRVLKELGFCVHVKHPHKLIVMYLQVLGFEKNRTLMQLAWNYMNDSLRTDVFVQYQPETVACACIYLTARRLNIALPRTPPWFSIFRVEERDIQDICYRILRLYIRAKPNADVLEKRVEDLRRQYQEARQKARGTQNMNAGSISPSSPSNQSRLRNSPQRWGGFISRNNHSAEKNRSQSRSRSPSHSPVVTKHSKKTKKNRERSLSHSRSRSRSRSRTRTRSRSHERRGRKWSKNRRSYSRSVSTSPYKQRKARDKVRHRSRSRSHDRRPDSYDRYYSSSKSRSRHSSRDRKDRR